MKRMQYVCEGSLNDAFAFLMENCYTISRSPFLQPHTYSLTNGRLRSLFSIHLILVFKNQFPERVLHFFTLELLMTISFRDVQFFYNRIEMQASFVKKNYKDKQFKSLFE